jgi:RNA polymerase sigma-70 factor (ECF subfamily)
MSALPRPKPCVERQIPRSALPRSSRTSEVALIERLRAGDAAAWTTLVRRYHATLLHHACRILRDRGLAEDVAQEAWGAAFGGIDGFNPRSSLFAWLVTIVINRARGLRRREVRSIPLSSWRTGITGAAGDEDLEPPVLGCNELSPERLLLEHEALRRFNDAIQALPDRQRSVLLLRDFAAASPAEACRALRINDLTLRVRLCRARASIRRALSDIAPGPVSTVIRSTRQSHGDVCPTRDRFRLKPFRRLSHAAIGLASAMAT